MREVKILIKSKFSAILQLVELGNSIKITLLSANLRPFSKANCLQLPILQFVDLI